MSKVSEMTKIQKVKIVAQERLKDNYYQMILYAPYISRYACPGQFINIKISDNFFPFLRRPFSIHKVEKNKIWILYEIVGKGTEILAQKRPFELLDIIGPLGNSFSYHLALADYREPILVAGGMGVAPLLFLAQKIVKDYPKFTPWVFLGARTKDKILCRSEFKKLNCQIKIATDDGTFGFKGKVSDLLINFLRNKQEIRHIVLYACGPQPMLKEVSKIAKNYRIPTQVSLEEHMACGIGACLGCVVKTKQGYQRVCKEGPVFNAEEIIW